MPYPSPFPASAHRLRRLIPRQLILRIERLRLARRIRELRGLLDVPHDIAEHAGARIERLARRDRALARMLD
jgi:hypothetical protein